MNSKENSASESSPISIGWAMRDITPEGKVRVMGQFHVRVSTGVENPLTCTALALESGCEGGAHAVLLSVDAAYLVDAVMQEFRRRLAEEVPGLDPRNVCAFTTHTHTAPCQDSFWYPAELPDGVSPDKDYADMLAGSMTETVKDAWAARKPAQVSWGSAQAVVGHNRRVHYEDGSGQMYGPTETPAFRHMEGGADHTVNLLFTYDPQGELTGILVNVPCPSQARESQPFVSADFWHETREEIRKRYGDDIFILPQCGIAGDQSPHPMLHARAHIRMLRLKGMISSEPTDRQAADVTAAECRLIGERIAAAVDEASTVCAAVRVDNVPFGHSCQILDLPYRMVTAEEARFCSEEAAREKERLAGLPRDPAGPAYTSCHSRIVYNERVVTRYKEQLDSPTYATEVHVLRLGDVGMAFVPFELYLDYGLRVQERSPAVQTFTVQLLGQDNGNAGLYLPTERAVRAGDYGGNIRDNKVGPTGGQVLVDSIVRALRALWHDG